MDSSNGRRAVVPSQRRRQGDWITCNTCGKRGWVDRRRAKAKIKELQEFDWRSEPLSVYRCETGLYHVGHKKPGANLNDPRLRWVQS